MQLGNYYDIITKRKEKCIENIHIRVMDEKKEENIDLEKLQEMLEKIKSSYKPLDPDDLPTDSTPYYEQESENSNKSNFVLPEKISEEQIKELIEKWKKMGNPKGLRELYDILAEKGYVDKIVKGIGNLSGENQENKNPKSVKELLESWGYLNEKEPRGQEPEGEEPGD